MGPVGPIGYPGPKGLKVREWLSSLSSHPSIAGLKVILFLLWTVVTVLREGMAAVLCVQAQDCLTQHPTGALQ